MLQARVPRRCKLTGHWLIVITGKNSLPFTTIISAQNEYFCAIDPRKSRTSRGASIYGEAVHF
jgi:hypothetical protein